MSELRDFFSKSRDRLSKRAAEIEAFYHKVTYELDRLEQYTKWGPNPQLAAVKRRHWEELKKIVGPKRLKELGWTPELDKKIEEWLNT